MKTKINRDISESYQHLTCRSSLLKSYCVENERTKFLMLNTRGIFNYEDGLRMNLDRINLEYYEQQTSTQQAPKKLRVHDS